MSKLEVDHNILCFWKFREITAKRGTQTLRLQTKANFNRRAVFRKERNKSFKGSDVICPFCAHELTRVIDKREGNNGKTTRRRRECQKCNRRFTTFERAETLDLLVIKKDGKREAFDRIKLRSGIIKACEKRPISADDIEKIIDEIEADLRKDNKDEVSSKRIGELVTRRLKKIDQVAYIRFASVYRQFADLSDFEKELTKLSKGLKREK